MQNDKKCLPILDGWRALSILLVLAGHWLPLGPAEWQLNASVAASGVVLFFCLSGFLMTEFLSADPRVGVFLVKRLFRIISLAWLAIAILVFFQSSQQLYSNVKLPAFCKLGFECLNGRRGESLEFVRRDAVLFLHGNSGFARRQKGHLTYSSVHAVNHIVAYLRKPTNQHRHVASRRRDIYQRMRRAGRGHPEH